MEKPRAFTLLELLISILIFVVIILGFLNIELFSHYHLISSDRRAKLQNDLSFVLEHMNKQIGNSIGNEVANGADTVIKLPSATLVVACVDLNRNGRRDNVPPDGFVAYRFQDNAVDFCSSCNDMDCGTCTGWERLSSRVNSFSAVKPNNPLRDGYIEVALKGRWIPAQAISADNPEINLHTRVSMPSVSTN